MSIKWTGWYREEVGTIRKIQGKNIKEGQKQESTTRTNIVCLGWKETSWGKFWRNQPKSSISLLFPCANSLKNKHLRMLTNECLFPLPLLPTFSKVLSTQLLVFRARGVAECWDFENLPTCDNFILAMFLDVWPSRKTHMSALLPAFSTWHLVKMRVLEHFTRRHSH